MRAGRPSALVRDHRDVGSMHSLAGVAVDKFPTDGATLAPEQWALRDRPHRHGYFVDFGEVLGEELLDAALLNCPQLQRVQALEAPTLKPPAIIDPAGCTPSRPVLAVAPVERHEHRADR